MVNYIKTSKFRYLNPEYFYDELKMIYLFLEAHKTMICSQNDDVGLQNLFAGLRLVVARH